MILGQGISAVGGVLIRYFYGYLLGTIIEPVMGRSCVSKGCSTPLHSWDPHPACCRHRSCVRTNPCGGFCIGFASEHWDILELERASFLGLRPKKGGKGSTSGRALDACCFGTGFSCFIRECRRLSAPRH